MSKFRKRCLRSVYWIAPYSRNINPTQLWKLYDIPLRINMLIDISCTDRSISSLWTGRVFPSKMLNAFWLFHSFQINLITIAWLIDLLQYSVHYVNAWMEMEWEFWICFQSSIISHVNILLIAANSVTSLDLDCRYNNCPWGMTYITMHMFFSVFPKVSRKMWTYKLIRIFDNSFFVVKIRL